MSCAKELGKGRWQRYHPDLLYRARLRLDLARDLSLAVERQQLVAVYRGLISPLEFISIVEETGLMVGDADSRTIVDNVIRLAHSLDVTVVAEGVQDEAQAEALTRLGCETGQGYCFSRPVDAATIEALLDSHSDRALQ